MSETQRKVHIVVWGSDPTGRGRPIGRASCGSRSEGAVLVNTHAFCFLPRVAQCERCHAFNPSRMGHGTAATPLHILSVSILCGALAGALDATLSALIAAYVAESARGGDAPSGAVALDLAEQRGYATEHAMWPTERREWLEVTGRHEHVWLSWRSGDEERAYSEPPEKKIRRCPCGMFEHEVPGTWAAEVPASDLEAPGTQRRTYQMTRLGDLPRRPRLP